MDPLNTTCLAPNVGAVSGLFAAAIQFFAAAHCMLYEKPIPVVKAQDYATYDFIIVGGGTAGCVLANRLSEVKHWKVLVIEAGSTPPMESAVPVMQFEMYRTKYDWQYGTQDDGITDRGLKTHSVYWPRGKMLGGSSNANAMLYCRGSMHDYQRWYNAGNTDWSPEVVTECFKKAESLKDKKLAKNKLLRDYYGKDGPLVIDTFESNYRNITDEILKSWKEIGVPTVVDMNYAGMLGAGISRVNAHNGRRGSVDHLYLKPVIHRTNLHVMTDALVTKILIKNYTREAYGVEVDVGDKIIKVLATKEVILSAGTVNTPQILLLSGIGPKQHLKSLGIPLIVDLPAVGKNLQDHLMVPVIILGDSPGETNEPENHMDVLKYLYEKKGGLSQNCFSDIMSFYSKKRTDKYPLFQLYATIFRKKSKELPIYFHSFANFEDVVANSLMEHNKNHSIYLFAFTMLHPLSKGQIILNTKNPRDHPLIFPNYFGNKEDLKTAVAGIKMLTKITRTKYFKSINGRLCRMSWPECDHHELDSEKYWSCIALNMLGTVYNLSGTAKMGTNTKTSVVSSKLKVHYVKKLRVIDGSAIPTTMSGNLHGPIVMMAERAANLIKDDYYIEVDPSDKCR